MASDEKRGITPPLICQYIFTSNLSFSGHLKNKKMLHFSSKKRISSEKRKIGMSDYQYLVCIYDFVLFLQVIQWLDFIDMVESPCGGNMTKRLSLPSGYHVTAKSMSPQSSDKTP